jgi:hypothetical protein
MRDRNSAITEAEKSIRIGSSEMPGLATTNMPANIELPESAQSTINGSIVPYVARCTLHVAA